MEIDNEQLKRENETLKRKNAELREEISKLKQSLDEAVRSTRPKPQPPPRRLKPESEARSETTDRSRPTDSELQRQLNKAMQQLSHVQERLTVSQQVTAATRRRQLVQEGAYENLPSHSVYEKLRFNPTQEAKLQPPTHPGRIDYIVFSSCCEQRRPYPKSHHATFSLPSLFLLSPSLPLPSLLSFSLLYPSSLLFLALYSHSSFP